VPTLLLEALKAICTAEEESQQEILLAQEKADEEVGEADHAGKKAIASTIDRAESEIAHLIRTSDQKATEQAKELASKTANRKATQRARAERRLDDAASLIVERIVKV
jgi:V/A-type H+-transporting ATPase subunit G/H